MSGKAGGAPRILHLQSSFTPHPGTSRAVRLINAFGPNLRHTIVSARPDELGAADHVERGVKLALQPVFPPLKGLPGPGRLQRIAKAMRGYDLVLTYNWGAIDAVLAHTLFSQVHGLPPLIHHEDGLDEAEPGLRGWRRTWYRRIALGRASGLVVPTEALEEIALVDWQQPLGRVKRIPFGIDTAAFAKKPKPDAIARLLKRPGENWVGALAPLRPAENLPLLVRAFAPLSENWHLVILGEGPERERIEAEIDRLRLNHRVHLPGAVADLAKVVGLFDIVVHPSGSRRFPLSVIQAMAAARPVVAPETGDIARIVAEQNRDFLAASTDPEDLETELVTFAVDKQLRESVGAANRAKARAEFDEARMIATYRRLYASAMRRQTI